MLQTLFFFSSKCLHLKACQGAGTERERIKGEQDAMSKQTHSSPGRFLEAKLSVRHHAASELHAFPVFLLFVRSGIADFPLTFGKPRLQL